MSTSVERSQVPVFILAGGLGTRISEESHLKPKPMLEIGETPILVHIMRSYYRHGFNDFVICAGYRSWAIKDYFLSYEFRANHLDLDHRRDGSQRPRAIGKSEGQENCRVRVIDTGLDCMTGARIARAFAAIEQEKGEPEVKHFAVTYGDGVSDVNLTEEFAAHLKHGKTGTVLGVAPQARFGELDINPQGVVEGFLEKPEERQGLINGGFFFFEKSFRKYLTTDPQLILEREPLVGLAKDRQLMVHRHTGFWHPMDTLRDKTYLQGLWDKGQAPWAAVR